MSVQGRTIADGIAVGRPGDVTYAHVAALVDEIVTVSEESLARAVLQTLERSKLLVEPAGAAAVAAVADRGHADPGGRRDPGTRGGPAGPGRSAGPGQDAGAWPTPVVAVLTGGNADPLLLEDLIRRGLVAAGRYATLGVRLPDRPGSLADVLRRVGARGGNVVDVEHQRLGSGPPLPVGTVEVTLTLEARGHEHRAAMVADLVDAGYDVHLDPPIPS